MNTSGSSASNIGVGALKKPSKIGKGSNNAPAGGSKKKADMATLF